MGRSDRMLCAALAAASVSSCAGGRGLPPSCRFSLDGEFERASITQALQAAGISPALFDMAKPFVSHDEDGRLHLTYVWKDKTADILDPPNLEVTFDPCARRVLNVQTYPSYLIRRSPALEMPTLGHL